MLEKLDLSKKMEKEIYRSEMEKLIPRLGKLQRKCKDLNIPVMIAFEGYGAAGKGDGRGENASLFVAFLDKAPSQGKNCDL